MAVVCLFIGSLLSTGCIQNQQQEGIQILATFYPLAFFAEEIGGEYVQVKQLIPDNTDIHTWQPTVADILAANKADILIYNGAHLDHWFEEDILPIINQTGKIIVKTTEDVQFLEKTAEEHDSEDEQETHDHDIYDPHTWISPFIARQQAEAIYHALITKDPYHLQNYTQQWNQLQDRFLSLDNAYTEELSTKQKDTIIVTHAAFGYLADRYRFHQYGVIGLSADEQPAASTMAALVNKMMELEIYVIYVDPVYSDNYAQTLKNTLESKTNQQIRILRLYLMSGVIDGLDYFQQLEANLQNLKIGLQASS